MKNGELRTYAVVNGRRIDYVNRHIKSRNETPERVTMAIPAGRAAPRQEHDPPRADRHRRKEQPSSTTWASFKWPSSSRAQQTRSPGAHRMRGRERS